MNLKTCCFALAVLGWAVPGTAQTNSAQTKMAPQGTPVSTSQSLILKALQNLRSVSGPRPRTSEQKAQEAAAHDRINDLIQAGMQALHTKDFVAAEADYRQLVQETTLGPFPYYGLGEALASQGKTAEALTTYKTAVYWPLNRYPYPTAASQAIENKPNLRGCSSSEDAVAWMKYALLLSQTGQNDEASSVYSQAVRHATDTNRSNIMLFSNDDTASPSAFQVAVHIALGLLANDTGNDRELAMSEFEQALRLQPDAAVTNYYYGYGWQRLDVKSTLRTADAAQAKVALQKAAVSEDNDIKKAATEALQGLQ